MQVVKKSDIETVIDKVFYCPTRMKDDSYIVEIRPIADDFELIFFNQTESMKVEATKDQLKNYLWKNLKELNLLLKAITK